MWKKFGNLARNVLYRRWDCLVIEECFNVTASSVVDCSVNTGREEWSLSALFMLSVYICILWTEELMIPPDDRYRTDDSAQPINCPLLCPVKRIDVIVEAPFSSESSLCQWSRRSRLLRHSIVYQRRLANQHQPIRDSIIVVCPLRRRICLSPIWPFWSPRPADRIRAINFVVRQRHRSKAARQMDLPKTLLVPKYPWNRKTDG